MRAFDVYLNGKRLCRAGIGDDGVLSTIITYVAGKEYLRLHVGGLITPQQEHVRWRERNLRIGDEIRVKIVESSTVDKPPKRFPRDPAQIIQHQKRYVRKMATKLGWKIQTRP